jgi:hypothetical protein
VPHPSVKKRGPDLLKTIDPTLTLGDLRGALRGIAPRLARIAQALETSANSAESSFELEGGCGVGKLTVQKPELLAAAASIEAIRAALQMSEAYDGDINVTTLLGSTSTEAQANAYVAMMNQHFLRATNPGALEAGRPILVRALGLTGRAVDEANAITATPANPIVDWRAFPRDVLADIKTYADAARTGLATKDAVEIPLVTPRLTVTLDSFLSNPLDLSKTPLWSTKQTPATEFSPAYVSVSFDGTAFEKQVESRFSVGAFSNKTNYVWVAGDRLGDVRSKTWEATFDPGKRFSMQYNCTSTVDVVAPTPTPIPAP